MASQDVDPISRSVTSEPRENDSQNTLPSSPAHSELSVEIPPDTVPLYNLRKKDRMPATTYQDNDNSGDFDLEEEARKQRAERTNKRCKTAVTKLKKKKNGQKPTQKGVKKFIEKLRFKDGWKKKEFEKFVEESSDREDNWPSGYSDNGRDEQEKRVTLRERKREAKIRRERTPGLEPQNPVDDPSGECLDLTGHPAARGCVSCRVQGKSLLKGNVCSMIMDHKYPCKDCKLMKQTCQPIVFMFETGPCKKCKEDGETCSRVDDPEQDICDYCGDGDHQCESTAPKEFTNDRIDIYKTMGRPHPSCSHCRAAGQEAKCSLKIERDQPPPCKRCKRRELGCTFLPLSPEEIASAAEAARRNNKRKRGANEDESAAEKPHNRHRYLTDKDMEEMNRAYERDLDTRASTPEDNYIEDTEGRRGVAKTPRTCFGHPCQFCVDDGEEARELPCNFCDIPLFHVTGHGEKKVDTILWEDQFHTEVGPGHSARHGVTRMCHSCVTSRIEILSCSCDEIKPMPEPRKDFEEALDELIAAQCEDSEQYREELKKWCSMCFSVTSHACVSAQESDGDGEEPRHGCGLRLCPSCEVALREEFGGDVSAMARMMDGLPKISVKELKKNGPSEGCTRADVGFLQEDGIFMKSVLAEIEEACDSGSDDGDVADAT